MPGYRTFRLRRGLPLLVGLALLGPHLGAAQEPERTATVEQCLQTIAALDAGAQHPEYVEAMSAVSRCARDAAPAVARWWDRARDLPEVELGSLGTASRQLRDEPPIQAVARAAQDPARGDEVRLEALATLMSYASPVAPVTRDELRAARPSWLDIVWVGERLCAHCRPHRPVPHERDVRRAVLGMLRDLSETDASPVVRSAALYLRQGMYNAYPDDTPLMADAVTLAYVCDDIFRVRNREKLVLILTFTVTGSPVVRSEWAIARKGDEAFGESYIRTVLEGSVQLRHRDKLLQKEANGRKPCNGWTPPPHPWDFEARPFSR